MSPSTGLGLRAGIATRSEPTSADHQRVAEFERDAIAGLSATPKGISSKYFYDEHGSRLFDAITELAEYYPTRTELSILRDHASPMARAIGRDCALIEYGSGSSLKIRLLLDRLEGAVTYAPIDISGDHLLRSAAGVAADYPGVRVEPIVGDFTEPVPLPEMVTGCSRRVVYFPGSTIGNLVPRDAEALLRGIRETVGAEGGALIGVDLEKPREVLHRAYNDARGVTAEFNLNVLRRMNEELDADFELARFAHRAFYNEAEHRVEMHLESLEAQDVCVAGRPFRFAAGETLRTEYSHKYTRERFDALAARAGLRIVEGWTDRRGWFGVFYLEPSPPSA